MNFRGRFFFWGLSPPRHPRWKSGHDKLSGNDGSWTVILSSKYRDRFKLQLRELHFYSPMPLQLCVLYMWKTKLHHMRPLDCSIASLLPTFLPRDIPNVIVIHNHAPLSREIHPQNQCIHHSQDADQVTCTGLLEVPPSHHNTRQHITHCTTHCKKKVILLRGQLGVWVLFFYLY